MMSSANTDTRTRILQAALSLLEASRGRSVRMTDIARQAGISRQAVYLHFTSRAALLVAATRHLDVVNDVDRRLAPSRSAQTGTDRLDAYIDAWGNYIPRIYAVARALLAMKDTDAEAAQAWNDRMQAMREGCAAAVDALDRDGTLSADYPPDQATDFLWTMLSVRNWEHLTIDCGWPQARYVDTLKAIARRTLVADEPRRA